MWQNLDSGKKDLGTEQMGVYCTILLSSVYI